MAKSNSNNIGIIRHVGKEDDFQMGELTVGDFVYGSLNEDNPMADVEVCMVQDIGKYDADLVTGRYRQKARMKKGSDVEESMNTTTESISDLTIIPLAEDWFAENSAIFRKLHDDETMKPVDSDLKIAFAYEFKARNWQATYYAVGFEIRFQDNTIYDRLQQEGLNWVGCQDGSRGKAIIVQIVKPLGDGKENAGSKFKKFSAAAVAQLIAVHELQHFLRLCGIFDSLNIPKRLIEDAEGLAELFGRK